MNKEITKATLKSIFGAVPYVGSFHNEIVFDYRSRIKQNRLNEFVDLLSEEFSKFSEDEVDFKKMRSDEFGDLFESILKRVIQTSSKEKRGRFKNILVDHMTAAYISDYTESFLDLIDRLNEAQIHILSGHSKLKKANLRELFKQKEELKAKIEPFEIELKQEEALRASGISRGSGNPRYQINELEKRINTIEQEINENNNFRKHSTYNVTEGEYTFLVQDLYSKGLLMDSIGSFDVKPFEYMYITEFGERFLQFINEE